MKHLPTFRASFRGYPQFLQVYPGHVDDHLQALLDKLRHGQLPLASLKAAASPAPEAPEEGARPTIVSTNAEATAENQRRLDALPGEVHTFKAKDWAEKPSSSNLDEKKHVRCRKKIDERSIWWMILVGAPFQIEQ